MNKLTIYKPIQSRVAGHHFEHLYCYALVEYMHAHKLFAFVDYHYIAKTYDNYVCIEVGLFTQESEGYRQNLINLGNSSLVYKLDTAICEIMNEKQVMLDVKNGILIKTIDEINDIAWQNIEPGLSRVSTSDLLEIGINDDEFSEAILTVDHPGGSDVIADNFIDHLVLNNVSDLLSLNAGFFELEDEDSSSSSRKFRYMHSQNPSFKIIQSDLNVFVQTELAGSEVLQRLVAQIKNNPSQFQPDVFLRNSTYSDLSHWVQNKDITKLLSQSLKSAKVTINK